MVFSTPIFLFVFLPITIALYYIVPVKLRNALLLISSLIFYSWGEPVMVVVMVFSIMMNYFAGLLINGAKSTSSKRAYLILAVIANLGVLLIFKYGQFLMDNINILLHTSLVMPDIPYVVLPIGISFFTFQAMSYVIDVYRRDGRVQKNIFSLALYISFFPQLIAGPIVRYKDIDEQIRKRGVDYQRMLQGVRRFVIGLAKKVLIANVVAETADSIFNVSPEYWTTGMGWLAMLCYALQIYFDFSGYSDMAIGLGKMFGFKFLENFNYPYIATSIRDFWRRWHMSLSNWFRDYLYIPLGGSRVGKTRLYLNQIIVFALCGMWHGASWNFLIWGLIHGAFLVLERMKLGDMLERVYKPLRHVYTLFVVLIAWVFFRAETLADSTDIIKAMFGVGAAQSGYSVLQYVTPVMVIMVILGIVGSTKLPSRVIKNIKIRCQVKHKLPFDCAVTVGMLGLLTLCMLSLASDSYNPFIYFRF